MIRSITFTEDQITGLFGELAAEDEEIGRFKQSFFKSSTYEKIHNERPLRILVAHNHPSGNVEPSENDIQLTKRLINAGKMIGIELIDHVIVGSEVYLSLAEEKIVEF